jgi:hypothetical protein
MSSTQALPGQDVTPAKAHISQPLPPPQTVAQAKNWALTYLYKKFGTHKKITWRGCDNHSAPERVSAYLAQYAALSCLVNGESRWNPAAVNRTTHACGFAQWNPCSKMSSRIGPDWRTRPVDQIRMVLDRYRDPYREQQKRAWRGWM